MNKTVREVISSIYEKKREERMDGKPISFTEVNFTAALLTVDGRVHD